MTGDSLNLSEDLLNQLKAIIPGAFSEGKLNVEHLETLLGKEKIASKERYELTWAGKANAYKVLQRQTTETLNPVKEDSINWDETENVFIEGENLAVLKVLQKSYYGKIKMIYIDPPYNTGSDSFIYPDRFSETKEEYAKRAGVSDEEGYMMKDGMFRKNSKENGHYHSNWLNMMLPRLHLARNLLTEDGVIFVSIGKDEISNLKQLLDQIFGEENFIEQIIWNKRIPKNDKGIGSIHEYVLLYSRQKANELEFHMLKDGLDEIYDLTKSLKKKKVPLPKAEKDIKLLYKKKKYDRGITLYNSLDEKYKLWGKINMSWPNADTFGPRYEVLHPITEKAVKIPDRGWRWKWDTFKQAAGLDDNGVYKEVKKLHDGSYMCNRIWFANDENIQPSSITYLEEVENFLLRSILSMKSDGGIEVEDLFGGKSYFSYPKPTSLLRTLVGSLSRDKNFTILDFFSGSGTLAHAVLDLNEEDNGNRKFICVQLPEKTDEDTEAYKAGYHTISAIAEARIKKVIEKIEAERNGKLPLDDQQVLGFRKFVLEDSNFKIWRSDLTTVEDLTKQMQLFVDPKREGTLTENVLWELLIKNGKLLTESLQEHEVSHGTIWTTEDRSLAFVLDVWNESVTQKILELVPKKVIALDSLFGEEGDKKSNAQLQCEDAGITFTTV